MKKVWILIDLDQFIFSILTDFKPQLQKLIQIDFKSIDLCFFRFLLLGGLKRNEINLNQFSFNFLISSVLSLFCFLSQSITLI